MSTISLRASAWLISLLALLLILSQVARFIPGRQLAAPGGTQELPPATSLPAIRPPLAGGVYWLGEGRDQLRSSYQPLKRRVRGLSTFPRWRTRLSDRPIPLELINFVSPIVYDGRRAYLADPFGKLYAADVASGQVVWETQLMVESGNPFQGTLGALAIGGDYLTVGANTTYNRFLFLVDRRTGRQLGRFTAPTGFYGSPLASPEVIWAPGLNGALYILRPDDLSSPLTTLVMGSKPYSAPAHSQGMVVAGSDNGRLTAYRAADGRVVWVAGLSGRGLAVTPSIYRQWVISCDAGGRFSLHRLKDGVLEWATRLGESCNASLVVDEEEGMAVAAIFPYGENPPPKLVGIDLDGRKVVWELELRGLSPFQIAGAGGAVFGLVRNTFRLEAETESRLVVVDIKRGEKLHEVVLPVPDAGFLAPTEGGLLVRLLDGSLALYSYRF